MFFQLHFKAKLSSPPIHIARPKKKRMAEFMMNDVQILCKQHCSETTHIYISSYFINFELETRYLHAFHKMHANIIAQITYAQAL